MTIKIQNIIKLCLKLISTIVYVLRVLTPDNSIEQCPQYQHSHWCVIGRSVKGNSQDGHYLKYNTYTHYLSVPARWGNSIYILIQRLDVASTVWNLYAILNLLWVVGNYEISFQKSQNVISQNTESRVRLL